MNNRTIFAIKVVILICFAVGFLKFVIPNHSVIAQSSSGVKPTTQETKPFDQEQALAALRKAIAGKETLPASEVFKNILMLKQMPAGRLLKVMELGYSRSLGVNCTHCHVPDQWDKDDKPTKPIMN